MEYVNNRHANKQLNSYLIERAGPKVLLNDL